MNGMFTLKFFAIQLQNLFPLASTQGKKKMFQQSLIVGDLTAVETTTELGNEGTHLT